MLTTELAAGARFRVVTTERVAEARRSLGLTDETNLSQESRESLHTLLNVDFIVTGTYLLSGDQSHRRIRLDTRILTMPGGDSSASIVEVGTEAELFDLVARTGVTLRDALGLSLPTAEEKLQARGLLPASPDAILVYTEALSRLRSYDAVGARDLLLRAEALEPSSAVIQFALSQAWARLGQDDRAREAARKAFKARSSLPQETQLAIEAQLYKAERQWDRASDTYRTLGILFPDELEYGLSLADTLSMAGRGHEALAVLAELSERPSLVGTDPRIDFTESIVAWRLSDLPRLEKSSAEAIAKSRRLGTDLITSNGLVYQAHCAAVSGRLEMAVEMLREAEELALRSGDRFVTGRVDANLGVILQQQGKLVEAEKVHLRALENARELGSAIGISAELYSLGRIYREQGDLQKARAMLEESLAWSGRMDYRIHEAMAMMTLAPVRLAEGILQGQTSY
jgi:tetratricopeptide (TPR) repeat protein